MRFKLTLVLTFTVCFGATGFAEDQAPEAQVVARQLVHPNSLIGWESDARQSIGWAVDDRQLIGGNASQPLTCDWTFGDFELRFDWTSKADGNLQVNLASEGTGPLQIVLCEGEGCGRILLGDKPLAVGRAVKASDQQRHSAVIKRSQDKLQVIIDDQPAAEAKVDYNLPSQLALNVPQGVISITDLIVIQPLGESLFNGEDLTGWWSQKKQDGWKVEDGSLVGQGKGGNYLRSEHEFSDFTLTFDYKISSGGNSGVGIRTPREGWPSRDGMELQILDRDDTSKHSQMSIYKYYPPLARPDRSGTWNHVTIKAQGRLITAWVNGQLAQHRDTATDATLVKRPLSGWIGFQDHGAKTHVRNVYVLQSP